MYTDKLFPTNAVGKVVLTAALVLGGFALEFAQAQVSTYQTIDTNLALGSRGSAVTALQTFLASDRSVYPSGRITGYFGPLTQEAVVQFQIGYGLPAVGRVGPLTREKMNALIEAGRRIDVSAPIISSISVATSTGRAMISWNTDEGAVGRVFYDTRSLSTRETDRAQTEPFIGGNVASDQLFSVNKQIVLSNLAAATTYYYRVLAIDGGGNVSVTVQNSFRTP